MIGPFLLGYWNCFYPNFGIRVWCRFGLSLCCFLGFVQRFKSRSDYHEWWASAFLAEIASTYCEMGKLDVKSIMPNRRNIVLSSCVALWCFVTAVCPRGVLKLENGPEEAEFKSNRNTN